MVAVAGGQASGPNFAYRSDTNASGEITIGLVANYQFTGTGRPDEANPRPCCEVVLMVDVAERNINVRAFNTTTAEELGSDWGYPFSAP